MNTVTLHNHESSFLRAATHSLRHGNGEYEYDGRKKYLQSIYALSPLHWKETQKLLKEYRGDLEKLRRIMEVFFSGIPYPVHRKNESTFQAAIISSFGQLLKIHQLAISPGKRKINCHPGQFRIKAVSAARIGC